MPQDDSMWYILMFLNNKLWDEECLWVNGSWKRPEAAVSAGGSAAGGSAAGESVGAAEAGNHHCLANRLHHRRYN